MKNLITLTQTNGNPIIIGLAHIISMEQVTLNNANKTTCTRIKSVGAMIETYYVLENLETIKAMINTPTINQ